MSISAIVDLLRCPHCGSGHELALVDTLVRCRRGHCFDLARQGYVNLLAGPGGGPRGDSPAMIEARDGFLARGHYEPIAKAVASAAEAGAIDRRTVIDLGAGTGYHLATTLDRLPDHRGAALDASPAALRRAARAHSRLGAVGADTWSELPLASSCADTVLTVFAPRNAPEVQRILAPGGRLIVVTPTDRHLEQLIEPLRLLKVDPAKAQRLEHHLTPHLELDDQTGVDYVLSLDHSSVREVAAMGPSAFHSRPDALDRRVAPLTDPIEVTASVTVSTYRRR